MKVLMLTPSYSPIVGGTERVVQNLTLKLNQNGIHTDVMTFNMNEKWNPFWRGEIKKDNFTLFRVPAFNFFPKMKYNPLEISLEVHVIPKLNFIKRLKDYDILHFHDVADLSFPLFSYFIKKPKIFQCHTLTEFYRYYKKGPFSKKILRKVADTYICMSNPSKKLLSDLGIPQSKIFILHNGVDPEEFKPNKEAKVDNMLLFVGRIEKRKGVHVLLNSLKYLEIPVSLKIAGPKNDNQYIGEIMGSTDKRQIGIHKVELLGYVNEKKLVELYQSASIVIIPSLVEDFGIVNLEALACETPVVASGVGGITEIVKNGVNGLLVLPNDPKKLANALTKLLENKELIEQYGINGRQMVKEHFSWDSIAKELISIYEITRAKAPF